MMRGEMGDPARSQTWQTESEHGRWPRSGSLFPGKVRGFCVIQPDSNAIAVRLIGTAVLANSQKMPCKH
jgi:hypothetical protein